MESPPERLLRRLDYDAPSRPVSDLRVRRTAHKTFKILNCEINRNDHHGKPEYDSVNECDNFTEEKENFIHMKLSNRSGKIDVNVVHRDERNLPDLSENGQVTEGSDAYAGTNDSRATRCDKATLIVTRSSSETASSGNSNLLSILCKRIDELEQKVLTQELCFEQFRSSCAEAANREFDGPTNEKQREPCCSYVNQYSHIPPVSAFNRGTVKPDIVSNAVDDQSDDEPSTSTHFSCERDLNRVATAYDGLVKMRSRRQTASMPLNHSSRSRNSAQTGGTSAYRSKSRPNHLRDYKLMDTVHYLAQGEFAPRNDGIKLTASREAVLSDIIWEDVCRTHWPQVNLTRRSRAERKLTHRTDLQRHIDSLLRDRLHHVERKKRKNYKAVMKVDNNNEQMKIGKGRELIVATNQRQFEERARTSTEVGRVNLATSGEQFAVDSENETQISDDEFAEERTDSAARREEPAPGPSSARHQVASSRLASPANEVRRAHYEANIPSTKRSRRSIRDAQTESRPFLLKVPHFVIKRRESFNKKKQSRREKQSKCRHYVFLPTIVVKAPIRTEGTSEYLQGVYNNTSKKIKTDSKTSSRCHSDDSQEEAVPVRDKDTSAENGGVTGHHRRN